jgi:hypothetical protein
VAAPAAGRGGDAAAVGAVREVDVGAVADGSPAPRAVVSAAAALSRAAAATLALSAAATAASESARAAAARFSVPDRIQNQAPAPTASTTRTRRAQPSHGAPACCLGAAPSGPSSFSRSFGEM